MSLLEVKDLKVVYQAGTGKTFAAVDGVTLDVRAGESAGLVGESGCGKSSLGNAALKLVPTSSGQVFFDGLDVLSLHRGQIREFRKRAQMVFQDPHGSLNPRLSIGATLDETLRVHRMGSRAGRRSRIAELLEAVGLEPGYASRYPHEFSGGQRQRIGIARAIAVNPSLIVADEPVSALDVSVQVQILNLMKDLQEQRGLAYLFIAHDLAVVRYMCSRVYVMYMGRLVESASSDELFRHPAHPYTEALMAAVPDVEKGLASRKGARRHNLIEGESARSAASIAGCHFHPRCRHAREICRAEPPPAREVSSGHVSCCHFADEF